MKLTEAMNTYNITLFILKEKGYSLKIEVDEESKNRTCRWIALKDHNRISGFSPLSLLALVTVFEKYGEKWNTVETGNIYDDLQESE